MLRCKNPRFWSVYDEMMLIRWAKKIKSLRIEFTMRNLLLEINKEIPLKELFELRALMIRYDLGIRQLRKIERMAHKKQREIGVIEPFENMAYVYKVSKYK